MEKGWLAPVTLLDPATGTFDDMQERFAIALRSRGRSAGTIQNRMYTIRRFQKFTGEYPWTWTPQDIEDYTSALLSRAKPVTRSTVRGYQQDIKSFCEFLTNPAYDWHELCLERFGSVPTQICNPWNTFAHASEFEADPSRRPFGYDELSTFFAHADQLAVTQLRTRSKGALPALRDSQLFKTVYAFGLRRQEAAMLDLHDLRPNPHMPTWGDYGKLEVRYGKAAKGSGYRRRTILSVPEFEWAVEGLQHWVERVRPLMAPEGPALWVSERRRRLSLRSIDVRFARIRDGIGLDPALTLHSLRHSYVTHLVELGYANLFVQEQVGHAHASTTAIYTSVSDDWKDREFQKAVDRVFGPEGEET